MKFVKFLLPVVEAETWVSPRTGEEFPFSWTDKAIYSLFRSRHNYFMDTFGKHDDKQAVIGECLGISREKVSRFLSLLTKEGVVESQKGGNYQNNYTKLNNFCVTKKKDGRVIKTTVFGYDSIEDEEEIPW